MVMTAFTTIDLNWTGRRRSIAALLIESGNTLAVVDPGPESTLETLRARLRERGHDFKSLDFLLLTHIHLDHAGATGALVRENPALKVYVHEKGAPHLVDPENLIASATRLWGDDMDRLWGEFRPVPAGNLVVVAGGERIPAGGRDLEG